jgi:GT2 family glycosyltransferase
MDPASTSRSAPRATPTVTVIVPARNAAPTLGECLAGLAPEGIPGDRAALVVVDDGSTDDTAPIAARAGASVVSTESRGPAGARNAGIKAAATDVVVFLDADTVPAPGWLRAMVTPLENPEVVAVKGRYRTEQRSPLARFTQLEFEWKYERLGRASRVDYVDTGTAAFRRAALVEAGGFDETLRTSEDVELAYRLAANGGHIVFSPDALVVHRHTEALGPYFAKKLRGALTRTLVYGKHPDKAAGDAYTPPLMGAQIALSGLLAAAGAARFVGLPGAPFWGALAAFLVTTAPVVRQALRLDPAITLLVPGLVYVRAFAQGLGMAAGLAQLAIGRSPIGRRATP